MIRKPIKLLKKERIKVSGKTLLAARGGISAANTGSAVASAGVSVPQEAKVIESNTEYAIIEIVCSCGQKMHIQCNYASLTQ